MANHISKMNNSNNFKQPEALRMADALEDDLHADDGTSLGLYSQCIADNAAAELRRLYAEVDRLSYQLAYPDNFERQPLTDEEILSVARNHYNPHERAEISFARAIEAAHGIKENHE